MSTQGSAAGTRVRAPPPLFSRASTVEPRPDASDRQAHSQREEGRRMRVEAGVKACDSMTWSSDRRALWPSAPVACVCVCS
eukprot:6827121-Prymnesium_polylepis.1